jgi:hypothetical protein
MIRLISGYFAPTTLLNMRKTLKPWAPLRTDNGLRLYRTFGTHFSTTDFWN